MKELYSRRYNSIIKKIPKTIANLLLLYLVLFIILIVALLFYIQYPDSLSAEITINSYNPSVKVVSKQNARIKLLKEFKELNESKIKQGQIIGYYENTSDLKDILFLDSLISNIPLDLNRVLSIRDIKNLSLGSIEPVYSKFIFDKINLLSIFDINKGEQEVQLHLENIEKLKLKIGLYERLYESTNSIDSLKSLIYSQDSILNMKQALSDEMLLLSKIEMEQSNYNSLNSNNLLEGYKHELALAEKQLNITKANDELFQTELKNNLLKSFSSLKESINSWKQNYLILSPISGHVYFHDYYMTNAFVQISQPLFTIIPEDQIYFGRIAVQNASYGKVKNGAHVIVKLDDYPYTEFGFIEGNVEHISKVSQEKMYLVTVKLDKDLISNTGQKLHFKESMSGTAEIILSEKSLIKRIFERIIGSFSKE